jgi:hypothetical protein
MAATPAAPAAQKFFALAIFAVLISAFVTFVGYFWWKSSSTAPLPEGFSYVASLIGLNKSSDTQGFQSQVEGFYAGPAVGAGVPNCMRSSKDCAALNELLTSKPLKAEEGADDLRELQVILSKISCFKRDLTGAAGVVEATRYQPFSTAHDLEPVAETTARCFAKTIPQRDLALGLDKWGGRGTFLIKRLCTAENLTEAEETEALRLFGDAMADINDIALGRCCNSDVGVIAGQPQPRMVGGFESTAIANLRQYTGYY